MINSSVLGEGAVWDTPVEGDATEFSEDETFKTSVKYTGSLRFSVLIITIRNVLGNLDLYSDIGKKQVSIECLNSSHGTFGDFI